MMPMSVYPPLTMPQLVSYLPNADVYGGGGNIVFSSTLPQPIATSAHQPLSGNVMPYIGRYVISPSNISALDPSALQLLKNCCLVNTMHQSSVPTTINSPALVTPLPDPVNLSAAASSAAVIDAADILFKTSQGEVSRPRHDSSNASPSLWSQDDIRSGSSQNLRESAATASTEIRVGVNAGAEPGALSTSSNTASAMDGIDENGLSEEIKNMAFRQNRKDGIWINVFRKICNATYSDKLKRVLRDKRLQPKDIVNLDKKELRMIWRMTHRRWHSSHRCHHQRSRTDNAQETVATAVDNDHDHTRQAEAVGSVKEEAKSAKVEPVQG